MNLRWSDHQPDIQRHLHGKGGMIAMPIAAILSAMLSLHYYRVRVPQAPSRDNFNTSIPEMIVQLPLYL
jgi:hypothetical protein